MLFRCRYVYNDRQPAPHEAQRVLEALVLALGTHGFTAARVTPDHGTTHRQLVTITVVAYRPHYATFLTLTIEHTQRYGLIALARWTLTDGRDRRRETKPLGFEWDADTTSRSLARRIAQTLDAYAARVCAAPVATR